MAPDQTPHNTKDSVFLIFNMNLYNVFTLVFIFSFTASLSSYAQGGIRFDQMSVKAGINKAKEKGKFLFVDTYAVWCIPCKKMRKVFADKDVAAYFNDHYINIKINMDGLNGRTTYNDYDVVFLPTVMIFDHEGRIKYKTDKLLTAQELLNIGVQANVEGVYLGNNASQIISTPFQSKPKVATANFVPTEVTAVAVKKEPTSNIEVRPESNSKEQIVKVLGVNDKMPPQVLYQEAYYQMQMMNDTQGDAAIAYLNTQEDWSTEKNIKFIYDFVESTNSILFDYIRENRDHVASIVGESNLSHSIDILVNQKVYQGFPRFEFQEARELYSLVNPLTTDQQAFQYYLNRMTQEGDKDGYLAVIDKYLNTVSPKDHNAMNLGADMYTSMDYDKDTWTDYKKMIEEAIEISSDSPRYYITLAKLFLMKDDRKKAKKAIEDAQEFMNENTGDLDSEINDILQSISKS